MADNGFGIAALVLGIVGLVLSPTIVFGLVLGVLALIFGILGRGKAKRGESDTPGQSLAGVILGAAALVATAVLLCVYVQTADDDPHHTTRTDPDDVYGAYMSAPVLVLGADASR